MVYYVVGSNMKAVSYGVDLERTGVRGPRVLRNLGLRQLYTPSV
jgi:hypothetical protein